jgi:hypothetical protein
MNGQNSRINNTKRIGVGLSFIIFPLIFIFAFAGHPNLLNPHFLGPAELIQRLHNNMMLHFGHALVTLCTGLLVVVAIHFMNLLKNTTNEWFGFIGGVFAIIGTLILAVDKIWGLIFLPIGFIIQSVGLLKSRSLATWQSILFLIGVLFIGTPDGVEIINLTAAILLTIAFVPYGIKMILKEKKLNQYEQF